MSEQNIYEKYNELLKSIRSLIHADYCSIFLLDSTLGMDDEEKKEVFRERAHSIIEKNETSASCGGFLRSLEADQTDKYSILTYFTGTGHEKWRIEGFEKRPQKYIVFNWQAEEADEQKSIIGEGLTALSARTGSPFLITNRSDIEKNFSFAGINEGSSGIHNACNQVAVIPLMNSSDSPKRPIGVLRCDIYDYQSQYKFSEETIKLLSGLNDLICNMINLGKDSEKILSYSNLFRGINILESLKTIRDQVTDDEDRKVYVLTKKLFYVLKRRRYFGYTAIIERVMGYLDNVCDKLDLNNEPLRMLLESFKKHEDLMLYSNEKYRDHFMHQFHVFILGYVIMHFIGLDKIIAILRENSEGKDLEVMKPASLLRIWFLASVFHDSCYLLPTIDGNVSCFLTEILESRENRHRTENAEDKFTFNVELKWDQLAKEEAEFLKRLSEIAGMIAAEKRPADLCKLTAGLCRLMLERDHGVLSAVIMMQKMAHASNKGLPLYRYELRTAAMAIALHTSEAHAVINESLSRLDERERRIYFESNPMAFLLAYCDFTQEWGRKESEIAKLNGKRYAHPRLHSLAFENGLSIQTRLVYNFRDFEAGQEHPSSSEIRNWLKSLRNTFSSFNYSFKIIYYELDTESPTAEELNKGEIASIDLQDSYKRKALRKRCNEFLYRLPTGQDVYMTDYSRDVITGAVGIGFGTNDDFVVGGGLDLKLSYNNVDLSGHYKVARADPTKEGLRYTKFVGARRQL